MRELLIRNEVNHSKNINKMSNFLVLGSFCVGVTRGKPENIVMSFMNNFLAKCLGLKEPFLFYVFSVHSL